MNATDDKVNLEKHVARALAYCKIAPRKTFVLSKRKKKLIDMQFEIESQKRKEARLQGNIDLDQMIGYIRTHPRK